MNAIRPRNPELLTDLDVEYRHFHCCGDEDLVFLRCAPCGHVWVECFECSTWYVDLNDPTMRGTSTATNAEVRVACPSCGTQFADAMYLSDGIVDRYLPTAEQVRAAGFTRYLAEHLRTR